MPLERMDDFFAARIDSYDEHMKTTIDGADEFYAYTASLLPVSAGAEILDLGCGTGLELEQLFIINPAARVTGIDMSDAMLRALKEKYADKHITAIHGSYFDVPFGEDIYDAAVSSESLHHFTADMKAGLYARLYRALKENGYFVLTDYFAADDEEEQRLFAELQRLRREQGITDGEFYHFDTPLTVEHESEALRRAGFTNISVMKRWDTTCTLLARK
ncbi:MAG: class I SAM-dependent methyltransferase [Oscillospiraceae bacterium]|nr:class I SAM-dependent methyltransferase [Oscillospiraceae bacterium]